MTSEQDNDELDDGPAPLELAPDEFRALGHELVERIAEFLESMPERPTATGTTREEVCAALG